MRNRITPTLAAVAAAAVVAFAGSALAEPGHHHRRARAQGPDFINVIAALKSDLKLNTSQQAMWDAAAAQSKSARDTGRANFDKVRTAMSAELAKPEPDLAAVAAVADDAQAANTALRKQIRSQWLALYATFTPEQKAVVKEALGKRAGADGEVPRKDDGAPRQLSGSTQRGERPPRLSLLSPSEGPFGRSQRVLRPPFLSSARWQASWGACDRTAGPADRLSSGSVTLEELTHTETTDEYVSKNNLI